MKSKKGRRVTVTIFGINTPFLNGDYGHDLAPNASHPDWPCRFQALDAYRIIVEAKRLGFTAIRLWLCERGEGVRRDNGDIVGVHEDLLRNLRILVEGANLHGIALYPTLLDGNAWGRDQDPLTRSILADDDACRRFADHVVLPIAQTLKEGNAKLIAFDVINEPETCTPDCADATGNPNPIPWESVGRSIHTIRQALRSELPSTAVTAGTMHVFLPPLWRVCELDAVDVHIYHHDGGLPSRADLSNYVGDARLAQPDFPIIGGELGIGDSGPKSDESLTNYLLNAKELGYDAAFIWQLEGILLNTKQNARPWTAQGHRVSNVLTSLANGSGPTA